MVYFEIGDTEWTQEASEVSILVLMDGVLRER